MIHDVLLHAEKRHLILFTTLFLPPLLDANYRCNQALHRHRCHANAKIIQNHCFKIIVLTLQAMTCGLTQD